MRKKALLVLCILAFMALFGYLAEPASDPELTGETPDIREQIKTSDEDCYTDPTKGDPKPTYCLLKEEPPDILVKNLHDERHNVTLQIIENSAVTHSANLSIGPVYGGIARKTVADVVQTPGNYTIRGTIDGERSESYHDSVEDIYEGNGGAKWVVVIGEDGELQIRHILSY